jgi:SAM-dependent methyltransferase
VARALRGRGGIEHLVQSDLAPAMVARATGLRVACDEERLPFAEASFDLVISALSLHWVNDLPGVLAQVRRLLKPDGLMLCAMIGGDSLAALRAALIEAESAFAGGASPRVAPMVTVRDAGILMQRAGFAMPVVDTDSLTVSYADAMSLMRDLRAMAEGNALARRARRFMRRDVLADAAARYAAIAAEPGGRVGARFEVITLTGWAPDRAQPQPLKPGSAQRSLAEALAEKPDSPGDASPRPARG